MTNIVIPVIDERIKEKDKNFVQFFDKKKQITNEDLQTVAVNKDGKPLGKNEKPIYELYIEITNGGDPYSVITKKVEGNDKIVLVQGGGGSKKRIKLTEFYKTAYERYLERQSQEDVNSNENELLSKIQKLEAENELLKNAKPLSKKQQKKLEEEQVLETENTTELE